MSILKRVHASILVMLLLIVVTCSGAAWSTAGGDSDLRTFGVDTGTLDAYVHAQRDRAGVPGVAYAVVGVDGVEHRGGSGRDGDGRPISSSTPFLWGSVSKPVTATLAVLLAGDGRLDLDARVVDLLPTFVSADSRSAKISVRQLLDHTSGLPEGLRLTDRYDSGRDLASVVAEAGALDLVNEPGTEYAYSSLNYIVLAAVIERIVERPFGQVLSERLLLPAQMSTTAAEAARAEQILPPGHRYVFGKARPFDSRVDPATVPAGYLVGSIDDLAAFARINLAGGNLLDEADRQLLHTATVRTGEHGGYALGWRTWHVPGSSEAMIWHAGAAPGYQSAILLLPERNRPWSCSRTPMAPSRRTSCSTRPSGWPP